MHDAGVNSYAAGSWLSKKHEAVVDAGLQLGQKVMRAVIAKPKLNVYDHDTQDFSCKNLPLMAAMIVNENNEESSATTSTFLRYMRLAGWDCTDPREHKVSPIEKGQVFVFTRNDDLFDMNDPSKVARIVVKTPPPAAEGSAETPWSQGEEGCLFNLVSEYKKNNSSSYNMWPKIMVEFNKEYPSRGITAGRTLRQKYNRIVKKMELEAQSSDDTKVSASDKKPASKKAAKGATKSVGDGAATAMPEKKRKANGAPKSADAWTNAADATDGAEAAMPEKKMKVRDMKARGEESGRYWNDNELHTLVSLMRTEDANGGDRLNRKKIAKEFLSNRSSNRTEEQVVGMISQIKKGKSKYGNDWKNDDVVDGKWSDNDDE